MARRGSYPHPVLGDTDDVSSLFEVFNFHYTPSVDDIAVTCQVRMTDPDVKKLLDNGMARLSLRWSCSSTISCGELNPELAARYADSDAYEGWLDQQDVRGKVRVEVQILATEQIDHYRLSNQHTDYGDATFRILPGDVLAYAGPFEFKPDKRYDPMDPPVGALFKFVGKGRGRRVKVRFDDDEHILVIFDDDLLAGLKAMSGRVDLQIGLVVLPALMQTITYLKENSSPDAEDLTGRDWYAPIHQLVSDNGGFETPAIEVAQKILGNPLHNSLHHAFETEEGDE
jgi:hypothetical protein